MEETLRDLQLVMAAHPQALAETRGTRSDAPDALAVAADQWRLVMQRLALDIRAPRRALALGQIQGE